MQPIPQHQKRDREVVVGGVAPHALPVGDDEVDIVNRLRRPVDPQCEAACQANRGPSCSRAGAAAFRALRSCSSRGIIVGLPAISFGSCG